MAVLARWDDVDAMLRAIRMTLFDAKAEFHASDVHLIPCFQPKPSAIPDRGTLWEF